MSREYNKKHRRYVQLHTYNFISDRSGFKWNSKDLVIDHHGYAMHWSEYDPYDIIELEHEVSVPVEPILPMTRPEILPDDPLDSVDTDVL
jgi:hypothetical protein